ncbi:MAG: amidohydrolase family protein, partial [Alphaproteobacteria bacterium]|nr:amidohydrolase family protein [Alphaproteobacteria bacterium]
MTNRFFGYVLAALVVVGAVPALPAEPVSINYTRAQLEQKWQARIQSFLDRGVIPIIDMESSLKRGDGEDYLDDALAVMDELGLALIAFDGYSPKKKGKYIWGYYIHEVVNAHPDRIILATNGGTNKNWLKGKGGFIGQVEDQVQSGQYPIMGEFDFRHYMSGNQCKKGKTGRDSNIPLDGENGERLFQLSVETGVPFAIHHEPEDHALDALEAMLGEYPKAKVIVAHFGQIRHPEKETRFGPDLVRRLFKTYPNLYYDLSTGRPGRTYKCNDKVLDTVIWQGDSSSQTGTLKSEYKDILSEFSDRFVAGTDYGGGRSPLPDFLKKQVKNLRLIMRDLPGEAKHDIGYRNAWKLLTGRAWSETEQTAQSVQPAATETAEKAKADYPQYKGVISDGHGHFKGKKADGDATMEAMDRNNIDVVLHWVKHQGGWKDSDSLDFSEEYPGRVIPGIAFQNKGWTKQKKNFIREVREKAESGDFKAMGEVSVRGKIGGNQNSPPDSPLLKEVM